MTSSLAPGVFTPVILVHMIAAIAATALGAVILVRRKGSLSHRRLGRLWALLMLVIIASSFFIKTSGHFSWIHLLSVGSLVTLGLAVHHARRGNLAAHRRCMTGLYVGALLVAGLFTLLPSRLLGWHLWHALG